MDNLYNIFDYFSNNVLKNNKKISANEMVHIFIELVLNHKNIKIQKKNKLVLSDETIVDVNKDNYDTFIRLVLKHDFKEKDVTEIADRLIEDTERRRKGEFYTPTIWVNEAHKMITEQFGEGWRDEFVVWDCAWGTGNLTRDYKFKELYCSTLNEGDLEIGKKYNKSGTVWNEEGTKFQYDFLNDDVDFFEELKKVKEVKGYLAESDFVGSKLYSVAPSLIRSLLDGKKLMFLINPPYGTSGNISKNGSKAGIALNSINGIMKGNQMGSCSQQLYAQFLYRICLLKLLFNTNTELCVFAKSSYLTSVSFAKFRLLFLQLFNYCSGMLFQASNFADVKGQWGIDFSIWSSSVNISDLSYPHIIKDISNGAIYDIGLKSMYNLDGSLKLSDWISTTVSNKEECVSLKTAITMGTKIIYKDCDALSYLINDGNNVYGNNQSVYIINSKITGHLKTTKITKSNILDCTSLFSARRLISGKYANWINDKDEYMIPNIEHELYKQWESDCIVYSLFNTASNQSSLRQIDYNSKKWDIKNEFFFMSTEDMLNLADNHCNEGVYEDVKEHGEERYVYKLLQEVELSEDAQAVLDKAIELTKESFKYREMFNEDHPEYHINTWDAGWYQIKGVLKEYMPDELKEFNEMYKALGDRMRPLVYELGFLRK